MLNYCLKIEDNKLYFDKKKILSEKKYKKITGTNLYKLTGESKYDTADSVMLGRLGIFQPTFPEFYSIRGNLVEPIAIKHFEEILGLKIERWNPRDIKYDNYQEEVLFGGLKDGQIFFTDEYGNKRNVIVEVKSTDLNKREMWAKEIPLDYYYQAGLYALLDNATDVYFLVVYCNEEINDQIKSSSPLDLEKLEYDIFKLPFDNEYKKDVLEAKIKAANNAKIIFERGYIDLNNLPKSVYEELMASR